MAIKLKKEKAFLQQLKDDHPHVNVQYSEFGPVVASHLGSGGLGVGFPRKLKLINILK